MKQIQWFPGHMKKAQNEIQDKIKIVDAVIELLDARIPVSSRNQILYKLTKDKPRLVVLTKKDLADPIYSKKWEIFLKEQGFAVVFADLNNQNDVKMIVKEVEKLGDFKNEKLAKKGLKPQPVRAMIMGIPNVGKSTLINKMANRHAASVQNKPGHTKSQQWIKVSDKFELLDTPGILQPSYKSEQDGINLALTGSIKSEILPNEHLASIALIFMVQNYKENLLNRFPYLNFENSVEDNFRLIAKKRGYLNKNGEDLQKAYDVFLNEFKNGVLGQLTLERN